MGPEQSGANAVFEKHWNACGKWQVVLIARKFGRPTNLYILASPPHLLGLIHSSWVLGFPLGKVGGKSGEGVLVSRGSPTSSPAGLFKPTLITVMFRRGLLSSGPYIGV